MEEEPNNINMGRVFVSFYHFLSAFAVSLLQGFFFKGDLDCRYGLIFFFILRKIIVFLIREDFIVSNKK